MNARGLALLVLVGAVGMLGVALTVLYVASHVAQHLTNGVGP